MPPIPNTSTRSVILSAAIAGLAISARTTGNSQRCDGSRKHDKADITETSQPSHDAGAPRLDSVRAAPLNARAGQRTGRVAQRESTPFTRVGSQVQSLSRPP